MWKIKNERHETTFIDAKKIISGGNIYNIHIVSGGRLHDRQNYRPGEDSNRAVAFEHGG
jgi:hypothetical protein